MGITGGGLGLRIKRGGRGWWRSCCSRERGGRGLRGRGIGGGGVGGRRGDGVRGSLWVGGVPVCPIHRVVFEVGGGGGQGFGEGEAGGGDGNYLIEICFQMDCIFGLLSRQGDDGHAFLF